MRRACVKKMWDFLECDQQHTIFFAESQRILLAFVRFRPRRVYARARPGPIRKGIEWAGVSLWQDDPWKKLTVTIALSLIAIMDESHQSFFSNCTGSGPDDWIFDTRGAFCRVLVFRKLHRLPRIEEPTSPPFRRVG